MMNIQHIKREFIVLIVALLSLTACVTPVKVEAPVAKAQYHKVGGELEVRTASICYITAKYIGSDSAFSLYSKKLEAYGPEWDMLITSSIGYSEGFMDAMIVMVKATGADIDKKTVAIRMFNKKCLQQT